MWLNEMREKRNPPIMVKTVVPVIKAKFPKYDAQIHCKVERPGLYGIQLCPEAETAVREYFGCPAKALSRPRRADRRTLPCRIQCRLEKDEYDRLQTAIREDGYDTVQDWLRPIVIQYLNEKKLKFPTI